MIKSPFVRWWRRFRNFLQRRPHRTFRLTRRRDMPSPGRLPGYIVFTVEVSNVVKQYWRTYLVFFVVLFIVNIVLLGLISQESFRDVSNILKESGSAVVDGDVSAIMQSLALFGTFITGGFETTPKSDAQQVVAIFTTAMAWLSIVWFLRYRLGGTVVKARDAIYNAGAPFVATLIVFTVAIFQISPAVIGIILYDYSLRTPVLSEGVAAMMIAFVCILLVILSLYWVTATVLGMIIVTYPGTYPFRALKMAGDIAIGRRLSILLRLAWLVGVLLTMWAFVLIPIILVDGFINIDWLPLVPITVQLMSTFTMIFVPSYVYLLYRRMLDAAPKKRRR